MDRGNTTHSARVDDELAHETRSLEQGAPIEAHAEEFKLQEPGGEDEPSIEPMPAGRDDLPPGGLSAEEIEARSEIARSLPRSMFPAEAHQLAEAAQGSGARDAVVAQLRSLPAGRVYEEVGEVWHDLGGRDESDLGRS